MAFIFRTPKRNELYKYTVAMSFSDVETESAEVKLRDSVQLPAASSLTSMLDAD